jgi:DNA-binding CsgD family transcriptional regulator
MESGPWPSIVGAAGPAPVLVFLNDPYVVDRTLATLFQGMFDLTPTEARLCSALARGLTLSDAATELGSTIGTVRSHLQRLFRKTGTNRQPELLRRLGTIAALH